MPWLLSNIKPRQNRPRSIVDWLVDASFVEQANAIVVRRYSERGASNLSSVAPTSDLLSDRPEAVVVGVGVDNVDWPLVIFANAVGIPVILATEQPMDALSRRSTGRMAQTMKRCVEHSVFDAFITPGLSSAQALRSAGVSADRIATGLYPVAEQTSASSPIQRANGPVSILADCSGADSASIRAALKAIARLNDKAKWPTNLVCAGEAVDWDGVRNLAAREGVDRFVTYLVDQTPATLLAHADALMCLAQQLSWSEVVMEAVSRGVFVVAGTGIACATDVIVPGRTGYLLTSHDTEAISRGLASAHDVATGQKKIVTAVTWLLAPFRPITAAQELVELVRLCRHEPRRWSKGAIASLRDSVQNRWGIGL